MPSPVTLDLHGPVRVDTVPWHQRGVFALSVIARASYAAGAPDEPAPVPQRDVEYSTNVPPRYRGVVRDPEDVAPFREPEIMVAGYALATTRLTVLRGGEPILDRSRQPAAGTPGGDLGGFSRAVRESALGAAGPVPTATGMLYLADDFPRGFFQATPVDQRVHELRGGDVVYVAGFGSKRVSFEVPGDCPAVQAVLGDIAVEVAMRIDRLVLVPETKTLHCTWRGALTVPDEACLPRVVVRVSFDPQGAASSKPQALGHTAAVAPTEQAPPQAGGPAFMRVGPAGSSRRAAPRPTQAAPTAPMRPDFTGTMEANADEVAAALAAIPFDDEPGPAMAAPPKPAPAAPPSQPEPAFDGEGTVAMSYDPDQDDPLVPFLGGLAPAGAGGEAPNIPGAPWSPPSDVPMPAPIDGGILTSTAGIGDPVPPLKTKAEPEPPAPPDPAPSPREEPPPDEPSKPAERVFKAEPSAAPASTKPKSEPPPPEPSRPKRTRPNLKKSLRKKFGR